MARGDRVLDVAAGSGNVAIPAAETGATVVASDLTPELFDAGRARAAERGVSLDWREADAEALPFADGDFDVVLSCVGVMFAPHHRAAADELIRVCRPGGRIGLISWTPEGFIGRLFATMKPYAPAPPPGAQPPPLWGSEEHVQELLGDRVTDVAMERRTLRVEHFGSAEASATTSRRGTARRSRCTGRWPTSPSGPPPSTASWSSWPADPTAARGRCSWTGSTCWSLARSGGRRCPPRADGAPLEQGGQSWAATSGSRVSSGLFCCRTRSPHLSVKTASSSPLVRCSTSAPRAAETPGTDASSVRSARL